MEPIKFIACKYLDFSDHYAAKKNLISTMGETKVFWLRKVLDPADPSMVQFCKKVGRLNFPEACTCKDKAMCGDYEDYNHEVPTDGIDLD